MTTLLESLRDVLGQVKEEFRTKPKTREYKEGAAAYEAGYTEHQCPYDKGWRRDQWMAGLSGD